MIKRAVAVGAMQWRIRLAAVLSVATLATAGPATAATHSGSPSPDPSPPSTVSPSPSPDPVPQVSGVGSVISQPTPGATSHSTAPSVQVRVPSYSVTTTPQVSHPSETAPPVRSSTTTATPAQTATHAASAATTERPAHRAAVDKHRAAQPHASQQDVALVSQLGHRTELASRASAALAAGATITAAPARRDGTLLLIGAGVLLVLAAASGALLRKLWRLHGQWYGGTVA